MTSINSLVPVAVSLVILVFVVSMSAQILGSYQDQFTSDSYQYNITDAGLEAVGEFSNWFSIIILIVIMAVLIGIIVTNLSGQEMFEQK